MGTGYGGEVPCMDVGSTTGDFIYYVQASNGGGEVIATSGSRTAPNKVIIKNEAVTGEPPHLPGRPPPSRCKEAGDCPPGMPGCGKKVPSGRGWGATCTTDRECGSEYWCKNGTCESGVRTETDGEPPASGKYCDSSTDCDTGERCSSARVCERAPEKPKKVWLSLNIGQDFSFIGSQADVCGTSETLAAKQYTCIDKDDYSYNGVPFDSAPGTGNAINGGIGPATTRFLAGIEFLAGNNVTLGASARLRARYRGRALLGRLPRRGARGVLVRPRAFLAPDGASVPRRRRRARGDRQQVLSTDHRVRISREAFTPRRRSPFGVRAAGPSPGGGFGVMIPTGGAGQGVTAEMKLVALFPDSGVAMAPSIGYALGL